MAIPAATISSLFVPPFSPEGDTGSDCSRRGSVPLEPPDAGVLTGATPGPAFPSLSFSGSAGRATLAPQFPQKFFPGSICVPHSTQNINFTSNPRCAMP
jgi:hypothetical protein